MASPVASKGVATASPATGTIRATSAVALNGSATAPQPARDVQISNRANTRIGCAPACQDKRHHSLERADQGFSAMPSVNSLLAHRIVERILRLTLLTPDVVEAILFRRTDRALMLEGWGRPPAGWDEQK